MQTFKSIISALQSVPQQNFELEMRRDAFSAVWKKGSAAC